VKHSRLSLETFRKRLADLDALPQFAILGVVSGILTGLIVVLLRQAIEIPLRFWLPEGNPENFEGLGKLAHFLMPFCGALLIGILYLQIKPSHRPVGVGYVLERFNFHEGYLSLKSAWVQLLVGIVTLISGCSAGREGPAIHLGATCNSYLGRRFGLPNNSIRVLVGCGTAAAIAASFNTPIAGVIFAMEVVMMEYTVVGFTPIILAAVSATIVTRMFYGATLAFSVPQFAINSLWDIPFAIVLGIILGGLGALFIKIVKIFSAFERHSILLRAGIAGVICGGIAVLVPATMGIGYDSVNQALLGDMGILLLCAIALGKLLATGIAVGLGLPFGLIGPVVVVGATAGVALGDLGYWLLPEHVSNSGIYGMLGMGAMMGAVLQAPLAALMALLEWTGNPNIILPGMLTIIVSTLTSRAFFMQQSIFQEMLQLRGVFLNQTPILQGLRRVGVESLMNQSFVTTDRRIEVSQLNRLLETKPEWIVLTENRKPISLLPGADLARFQEEHLKASKLGKLETQTEEEIADLLKIPARRRDLIPIHRQATLQEALNALHNSSVEALYVERVQAPTYISVMGVITRDAIENYYMKR